MGRKTVALCVVVGLLPLLAGCSMRLADMTVISSRNVSLDKVDLDRLPRQTGVTGRDAKWMILFIPLGFPHLEDAIDDALDKGGGDIMVDAVIYSEAWWFLVGESAIKVKGTVVRTRGGTQ